MKRKLLITLVVLLLVIVVAYLLNRWLKASVIYRYDYPPTGNNAIKETEIVLAKNEEPSDEDTEHKQREEKLSAYFEKNHCPLLEYTTLFIYTAEIHGIDWRLLPAISMQESSCGKHQRGFNPFGFGYYRFGSFIDAITYVGTAISGGSPKEKAYHRANKDTDKILWLYNGTVNPSYPAKVKMIMEEISK